MLAVVNRVLHYQALTRGEVEHLIEIEITQPIQHKLAVGELHTLRHMALHAGDDICSGACQGGEVLTLIHQRSSIIALLVLEFGQHHVSQVFLF